MTAVLNLETICAICLQEQSFLISVFERDEIAKMTIAEKIDRCSELKLESNNRNTPNKICMSCINDLSVVWRFRQSCQTALMVYRNLLKHGQKKNAINNLETSAKNDQPLRQATVPKSSSSSSLHSDAQYKKIMQNNSSNNKIAKKDKTTVEKPALLVGLDAAVSINMIPFGTVKANEKAMKTAQADPISENEEYEEYYEIEQMLNDKAESKIGDGGENEEQEIYFAGELSAEDVSNSQESNLKQLVSKEEPESEHEFNDFANESTASTATPTSEYESAHKGVGIQANSNQNVVFFSKAGNVVKNEYKVVYKRSRGRPKSMIFDASQGAETKAKTTNADNKKKKSSPFGKICAICGNVFKYRHALETHMRRHENVRPFACEFCDKAFVAGVELQRHMRVHTGQKPYACQYCDRRFSDFGSRVKHERTHTGERPYKCRICGKSFAYPHVLTIHERAHLGEKRFPCTLCSKGFTKKAYLLAHMEHHQRSIEYSCMIESEEEQTRNLTDDAVDETVEVLPEEDVQDEGQIENNINTYIVEQHDIDEEDDDDNIDEMKFDAEFAESAQAN